MEQVLLLRPEIEGLIKFLLCQSLLLVDEQLVRVNMVTSRFLEVVPAGDLDQAAFKALPASYSSESALRRYGSTYLGLAALLARRHLIQFFPSSCFFSDL